ncbi:Transcriptional regulator [Bifidobacterium stellenboschense]|uniref:Transcriptional regulator n=2 Tax=Bifidobacterium stellenboschense TaxID=762211 RepID=A0A087D8P6_9BIFI|nr:Transcriptional regulator [Bifidobacterium stellenboschense]
MNAMGGDAGKVPGSGKVPGRRDTGAVEPRFDAVIHEPTRLRICGLLSSVREMRFADIREALGLSDAMCSRHLTTLAGDGYIALTKRPGESTRHMVTWAAITPEGRRALAGHLAALQAIAQGAVL